MINKTSSTMTTPISATLKKETANIVSTVLSFLGSKGKNISPVLSQVFSRVSPFMQNLKNPSPKASFGMANPIAPSKMPFPKSGSMKLEGGMRSSTVTAATTQSLSDSDLADKALAQRELGEFDNARATLREIQDASTYREELFELRRDEVAASSKDQPKLNKPSTPPSYETMLSEPPSYETMVAESAPDLSDGDLADKAFEQRERGEFDKARATLREIKDAGVYREELFELRKDEVAALGKDQL